MTGVRSRKEPWILFLGSFCLFHKGGVSMKKTILYTNSNYQLQKLKDNNLIVEDDRFASEMLSMNGYSNLIKSYRDPYILISEGKKTYRTGVTFNQIFSLYLLDKNLRSSVMAAMLDLEEHIKECAANVVALSFGTDPDEYLKFSNYRDRNRSGRFSLSNILNKLKQSMHTTKDPIKHYMDKYNSVPPWILFKSAYLSTIVNLIKLMKPNEQTKIAEQLYKTLMLSPAQKRMLMIDTLFVCLEYRNLVAHGGRTYNYVCNCQVRWDEIFDFNPNDKPHGFRQLLILLDFFDYKNPYKILSETLTIETNRHCSAYPSDVTYLEQILNVDIEPTDIVFKSPQGNKYHSDPHCSGIHNAMPIEMKDALKQGLIPCKRCCSD